MSIKRCAKAHFDKHVIKMILEYCQLLSTAWHMLDSKQALKYLDNGLIYKKTHSMHPSAIFTRKHLSNYMYVARLALELCKEWRYRYKHDKIHGCENKLIFLYHNPPTSINKSEIIKTRNNPKGLLLPLPQAMPNECKMKGHVHHTVLAYRKYYKSSHKSHIVSWTIKNGKKRDPLENPKWW
jgi:hypothetical protein